MITWEKAASCGSSQCVQVGQDAATERALVYLKSDYGRMTTWTTEEFRDFVAQCQRGEWSHV